MQPEKVREVRAWLTKAVYSAVLYRLPDEVRP